MDLYARLNILGGHSVRLPRGDLADAIRLDNDPVSRARSWEEQGADVIHVVDLDAAAHRDYTNRPLIDELIKAVSIPVQVAGGVRSPREARRLIEAGAYRVVMGTAAIEDQNLVWELCREFPDKIVVSLDVRPDEEVAILGWSVNSGRYLEDVLLQMSDAGVTSFLVAEASRDALVEPPNLSILHSALSLVDDDVIASGGVRNLDDLRDIASVSVGGRKIKGIIVGREVSHGRFTLAEARATLDAAKAKPSKITIRRPAEMTVDPVTLGDIERYNTMAAELERAAAQAKIAAQRLSIGERAKGHTHGLVAHGHISKAQDLLDLVARDLANRSIE